jgi:hypothetical protein
LTVEDAVAEADARIRREPELTQTEQPRVATGEEGLVPGHLGDPPQISITHG